VQQNGSCASANATTVTLTLNDYISNCFANIPDTAQRTEAEVRADGEQDVVRSAAPAALADCCLAPVAAKTASEQLSEQLKWDLPVPPLFGDICTVPEDTVSSQVSGARPSQEPRRWVRTGTLEALQLHAGAPRTIVPFHARNATWDLQLTGRKRWFMAPPGVSIDASEAPCGADGNVRADALLTTVAALRAQRELVEVIQAPGEVVFIPHGWMRALVHLEDSVSISQEFCTFLNTDTRVQPLGTVLYGGEDYFRGIGLYKTHVKSSYKLGVKLPEMSRTPVFDFAPVT
jgi:hypothetical protein